MQEYSSSPNEIKGTDLLNFAIDDCNSAKNVRLAIVSLLTLKEYYALFESIEDPDISEANKEHIVGGLRDTFTSGKLDLFARTLLSMAQTASSAYETDYYYTLCVAAKALCQTKEYHAFLAAYNSFYADISTEAETVRSHMDHIAHQIDEIQRKV